jgi:chromosome partitioning protein
MILSLVSQKGGSGKSTLAAAIAWELLHRGHKVLVVDTDPQGTLREVGQAAADANRPAPVIVAMGKELSRADQLPRMAEAFDHVIIDTPGRSGDVQNAALLAADVALIPVGQAAADVWSLTHTLEIVDSAQRLKEQFGASLKAALVITRRLPRTSLGKALRQTLEASGLPTLKSETTARVAWQECLGAGQGVAQYAPKDAAAAEARALVNEVLAFASTPNLKEVANG